MGVSALRPSVNKAIKLTAFPSLVLRFNATLPQNNQLQSRNLWRRYAKYKMENFSMPAEPSTLFSEIRSWLELFYFASGIVVMFLIGFGLWQLKLAKDQISLAKDQLETSKNIFKTQSKRASVEAAVVECRRFSETVIHDSLALQKFCEDNEITYFDDVVFEKTEDGFRINAKDVKAEHVRKLADAEDIINRYMNGLEAFSLFFLSGVADEEIAFHTNAKTFIQFAEFAFKLIPACQLESEDFKPVKTLYFLWHKKYEAHKLKIEKKKIETQLSNYKEVKIKAIGTA
jgi:hypothetical protein